MFGRMSRKDANLWRQAQTLTDLGELMALWLEGDIKSWPGYQPGYGPDDETRELLPALTAANRAGYVTTCSQPGCCTTTRWGHWQHRAAVQGHADPRTLTALTAAARRN